MSEDEALQHLLLGEIEVVGRINASSNQALFVEVHFNGATLEGCLKTELGERPLWDFPDGLWRREVAAYELSRLMALDLIPETVARTNTEFGPASLQRWVPSTPEHYFTMRDDAAWATWFCEMAGFDFIANNTDRKSGHVLFDGQRPWGIDQGLCFAVEDKLRTVIWDFAGDPLPARLSEGIELLLNSNGEPLRTLISDEEVEATLERAAWLLEQGVLPTPDEDLEWPPYPWPLV